MINVGGVGRSGISQTIPEDRELSPAPRETVTTGQGAITHIPVTAPTRPLLQPSAELAEAARALASQFYDDGSPVTLSQHQTLMELEGKYLLEKQGQNVRFDQVAQRLGLQSDLARDVHNERYALSTAVTKLHSHPQPDQMTALTHTLREAVQKQASLMGARAALYDEVLTQPLTDEQREHIKLSQLSFSVYAAEVATEIPGIIDAAYSKAKILGEQLGDTEPGREWKNAAEQLVTLKADLDEDFSAALGQAKLVSVLDGYQKMNNTSFAAIKAFIGGVPGQAVASAFTFALARWITEHSITGTGVGPTIGRIAATAVSMGIAHDIGSNLLRPAGQEMMGGLGLRTVDKNEVIPDANPFAYHSETDAVGKRNDDDMEAASDEVSGMRDRHSNAQQNHKVGTWWGSAEFVSLFSLAQLLGSVTDNNAGTDSNTLHGRVTKSGGAGALAGGIPAILQKNSTITDNQGRDIPTHTFKQPTQPLESRLVDVASDFVRKSNYTKEAPRKALASKITEFAKGLALNEALDIVDRNLDASTTWGQVSKPLIAGGKTVLLLYSLFGSLGVVADAKADKEAESKRRDEEGLEPLPESRYNFSHLNSSLLNIWDPDRSHVAHGTQAGTKARVVENTARRIDGLSQLISQGIPEGMENLPEAAKDVKKALASTPEVAKRYAHQVQQTLSDNPLGRARQNRELPNEAFEMVTPPHNNNTDPADQV